MVSKFGFNVHTTGMPAEANTRLYDSIRQLGSTTSLVLNDPDYAHKLQAAFPDMNVILRLMPSNGGTDDELHKRGVHAANHAAWYEMRITDHRIICHGMNEPQWVDNNQLDPAAIQWSIEFGQRCIERGLRAVLWNTGTGKVNETNVHALTPLIRLINQHPGRLYLGLHEYTNFNWKAWQPWLFGSFKFIHDECDALGLKHPEIIITEWGFDTVHERYGRPGAWSLREIISYLADKGTPQPAQEAARLLIEAYNAIYAGHDNIIGLCFYSFGHASDKWEPYDIRMNDHPDYHFLNTIINQWPRIPAGSEPPDDPEPDEPEPDEPTEPEPPDDAPTEQPNIGLLCEWLKWLCAKLCDGCKG